MTRLPLDRETILRRVNGIQEELKELQTLSNQSFQEFSTGVGYKLSHYHLHRALEGVFHIGSHILSRIPGAQVTEYKAIAQKLGEVGIVEQEYAQGILTQMAGYRNRLVHFYAEITSKEIFQLLQHHLQDFDRFLQAVRGVLDDPQKFGIAPSSGHPS